MGRRCPHLIIIRLRADYSVISASNSTCFVTVIMQGLSGRIHAFVYLLLLSYCSEFEAFRSCRFESAVRATVTRKSNGFSISSSSDAAAAAAYDFMQTQGEWYSMGGCSVLLPAERTPKSIIHFVGGFVAGSAVTVTYGRMLTALAKSGHLIIATPIPAVDLNHGNVAAGVTTAFSNCYKSNILPLLGAAGKEVPIFGLSHSLGGKLAVLMSSKKEDRKILPPRTANVFLAFNNYGVQDNIDLGRAQAAKASPEVQKILEAINRPEVQKMYETAKDNKMVSDLFSNFFTKQGPSPSTGSESSRDDGPGKKKIPDAGDAMADMMTNLGNQLGIDIAQKVSEFTKDSSAQIEFIPNSTETWQLLLEGYNVQRNYMVKFDDDEIDQSVDLAVNLRKRGCDAKIKSLAGNHLTPNVIVAGTGGDTASTPFLRELVGLFNDASDDAWTEIDRRRNEKLMLPVRV